MKLLLDVKDSKAAFVLELLNSFSFVKVKTVSPYRKKVLEDLKVAVEELNLIRAGKLQAKNAEDLLNEL